MESSLLLIKPDAVQHKSSIIALLESRGFFLLKAEETHFTRERATEYHFESIGEASYGDRISFVCSGPCYAIVVSKVRAVAELRTLVGPYDPEVARQTQPSTLRALYGIDTLRNAVNCSPSAEIARREINCIFPSAPLHVLESDEYLRETVLPGLVEAMADLCSPGNIPNDPYEALRRWLIMNRPSDEGVYKLSVLDGHVLKYDSSTDKLLSSQMIEGVRNFRKVKGPAPIYAMAQCPVNSREPLVAHLLEAGHSTVTFVNLREEPVIYIGGHSCTIRDPSELNQHVQHLANVEAHELVRIERRLAADVVASAYRTKGNVTVFNKEDEETIVEKVEKSDVCTLSESYAQLQAKFPNVNFTRIPVTAGGIPADNDVVELVALMKTIAAGGCVVFECSSGGGRSTLVLTMALLIWRILHATPTELNMWMNKEGTNNTKSESESGGEGVAADTTPLRERADSIVLKDTSDGDYAVVKQVLATIGHGATLKSFVDSCIGLTNDVIDLKKCTSDFLEESEHVEGAQKKSKAIREANRYLRSYCRLMVLGAYAVECAPDFHATFKDWHRQHWNLQRPLKNLKFN